MNSLLILNRIQMHLYPDNANQFKDINLGHEKISSYQDLCELVTLVWACFEQWFVIISVYVCSFWLMNMPALAEEDVIPKNGKWVFLADLQNLVVKEYGLTLLKYLQSVWGMYSITL